MKNDEFSGLVEKAISVKLKAIDRLIEEKVEPLSDVGNPEKLIKKDYFNWDANDIQLLTKIYGTGENTPLTRMIFSKTYEKVRQLEAEEKG